MQSIKYPAKITENGILINPKKLAIMFHERNITVAIIIFVIIAATKSHISLIIHEPPNIKETNVDFLG